MHTRDICTIHTGRGTNQFVRGSYLTHEQYVLPYLGEIDRGNMQSSLCNTPVQTITFILSCCLKRFYTLADVSLKPDFHKDKTKKSVLKRVRQTQE